MKPQYQISGEWLAKYGKTRSSKNAHSKFLWIVLPDLKTIFETTNQINQRFHLKFLFPSKNHLSISIPHSNSWVLQLFPSKNHLSISIPHFELLSSSIIPIKKAPIQFYPPFRTLEFFNYSHQKITIQFYPPFRTLEFFNHSHQKITYPILSPIWTLEFFNYSHQKITYPILSPISNSWVLQLFPWKKHLSNSIPHFELLSSSIIPMKKTPIQFYPPFRTLEFFNHSHQEITYPILSPISNSWVLQLFPSKNHLSNSIPHFELLSSSIIPIKKSPIQFYPPFRTLGFFNYSHQKITYPILSPISNSWVLQLFPSKNHLSNSSHEKSTYPILSPISNSWVLQLFPSKNHLSNSIPHFELLSSSIIPIKKSPIQFYPPFRTLEFFNYSHQKITYPFLSPISNSWVLQLFPSKNHLSNSIPIRTLEFFNYSHEKSTYPILSPISNSWVLQLFPSKNHLSNSIPHFELLSSSIIPIKKSPIQFYPPFRTLEFFNHSHQKITYPILSPISNSWVLQLFPSKNHLSNSIPHFELLSSSIIPIKKSPIQFYPPFRTLEFFNYSHQKITYPILLQLFPSKNHLSNSIPHFELLSSSIIPIKKSLSNSIPHFELLSSSIIPIKKSPIQFYPPFRTLEFFNYSHQKITYPILSPISNSWVLQLFPSKNHLSNSIPHFELLSSSIIPMKVLQLNHLSNSIPHFELLSSSIIPIKKSPIQFYPPFRTLEFFNYSHQKITYPILSPISNSWVLQLFPSKNHLSNSIPHFELLSSSIIPIKKSPIQFYPPFRTLEFFNYSHQKITYPILSPISNSWVLQLFPSKNHLSNSIPQFELLSSSIIPIKKSPIQFYPPFRTLEFFNYSHQKITYPILSPISNSWVLQLFPSKNHLSNSIPHFELLSYSIIPIKKSPIQFYPPFRTLEFFNYSHQKITFCRHLHSPISHRVCYSETPLLYAMAVAFCSLHLQVLYLQHLEKNRCKMS